MHKIRMYDARTQSAFRDRNRKRTLAEGPAGESYKQVESGRGALGYYIVSDRSRCFSMLIGTTCP
jgi:NADH:ubiquinone oxidoreductase subunit D